MNKKLIYTDNNRMYIKISIIIKNDSNSKN